MSKKKVIEASVKIAKPKKGKVKVEINLEESPVKVSVDSSIKTSGTETPIESPRIYFDGRYVLEILDDGKGNDKEYHCKMSDGTTTMVPKDLFVEKLKEE